MVKGRIILLFLFLLNNYLKDSLAQFCECGEVCKDAKPYERKPCEIDSTTEGANKCNNYCECSSGGTAALLLCPNNLGYDPETESCIWQNDVENCRNETTTTPSPTPAECAECVPMANHTYNPMLKACAPIGTYPCDEEIPKCGIDSIYEGKYVSDKKNCSGYYYCKGNMRLKGSCNATLYYFNPITQECVYKDSLNCTVVDGESGSGSGSGSSSGIDWANICSGVVNNFIPDPRVCNAYIYCNGESKPRQAFCPKGKYFNDGMCVSTPPASCTCEIHDFTIITEVPQYGSSTDPTKFNICGNGTRAEEECFPGTVWSQPDVSCVYP